MSCEDVVISAEGVGKAYALFDRPEDRLRQMLFGRFRTYYREFWALSPTDLQIRAGETCGILGRNGSGKSTLLQMICGNLRPTTGRIVVRGRIAALLELGAGFNPDFTGRENVYINGALVGFDRSQVDDRLDRILAFADIGPFIDQPVKTYSSGMFARLAFAVAINVDPDILVVDEALAVGDEAFQRKCFARMEQIKEAGATILFVSHSSTTVVDLCDRAVLLHQGEHLFTGRPKRAVALYQKLAAAPDDRLPTMLEEMRRERELAPDEEVQAAPAQPEKRHAPEDPTFDDINGVVWPATPVPDKACERAHFDPGLSSESRVSFVPRGAEIQDVCIRTLTGEMVNCIVHGERYELRYRVAFHRRVRKTKFYWITKTPSGTHLGGGTHPPAAGSMHEDFHAGDSVELAFGFACRLMPGTYFVNCGVAEAGDILHRILDALAFRVLPGPQTAAIGLVDFGITGSIAAETSQVEGSA